MTDKMMRPSDWPDRMQPLDPVKQLFDRVFEQRPPRDAPAHDPTVMGQQWIPAVDIKEEAHRFILYVDAPGVAPGTVEVCMEQGMVIIKGERKTESQEGRKAFLHIERRHGTFHRSFALPDSADPQRITVTAHDGILYIVIRKRLDKADRYIQIRTAKNEPAYAASPFNTPWRMA